MEMFKIANMEISKRIQQRMADLGLKAVRISNETGASRGSVSQWINGYSKPSGDYLVKLAKVLKCNVDWLLFGVERELNHESASVIGFLSPWDDTTTLDNDEVELPFFEEVSLAAGSGICDSSEHEVKKLRFTKSVLNDCGVDANNAVCVTIKGSSMEPVLPSGAVVGVDKGRVGITDGKIFAINHDGMLRVKVLYKTPGNGVRVRSFNSDEFPDEFYNCEQAKKIHVLGEIFWHSVLHHRR